MKKLYLFTLFIVLLGVSPFTVQAQSVADSVAMALKNNPSLEAAQARVNASKAAESEQFSGYFPQINAGAKVGRIFGDNSTTRGLVVTRGDAYSGYGEGTISMRQPILGMFQTAQQVSAAHARTLSADQSLVNVQEQLALMASKSYVELIRNREIIDHFKKRLAGMKELVSRIKSAVKEGGADETDLQRARDLIFGTKKMIAMSEAAFAAAREQYKETVGAEPADALSKPVVAIDIAPVDVDAAVAYALSSNPAYLASLLDSQASKSEFAAEKWSLAPNIDGELSYRKSDQKDDIGGETTDARALISLNWNFSLGGAQRARIKRKRYEYEAAKATSEDYKHQLEKFVRTAYSNYATQRDMMKYEKQRDALSRSLYKNSKVQFDGARISLLDLLRAYNERSQVIYDTINAKYAVVKAQYDLLASLGLLRESMAFGAGEAIKVADDHGQ